MAKPATPEGPPTVRAVLKYARELREHAERERAKDPNCGLYAPSDAAARSLSQKLSALYGKDEGPAAAIRELACRARLRELELEEHGARASAARREHRRHRLVYAGERQAELSRMSLGARLDAALRGLELLSEVGAVRLDGDRVKGGEKSRMPHLRTFEHQRSVELATVMVERVERRLESVQRRQAA